MPFRTSTGWVATKHAALGGSCSMSAPPKRPARTLPGHRRLGGVDAQTGTIRAVQLNLGRGWVLGPCGRQRHFDKAQRGGWHRRGRRVPDGDLLLEVRQAQPSLFGHARRRDHRGQRHRVGPEFWENRTMGVRPRLAPVGNWPASWSSDAPRATGSGSSSSPPRHRVCCLRMTVGYGKSRFTRARRKQTDVEARTGCPRRARRRLPLHGMRIGRGVAHLRGRPTPHDTAYACFGHLSPSRPVE